MEQSMRLEITPMWRRAGQGGGVVCVKDVKGKAREADGARQVAAASHDAIQTPKATGPLCGTRRQAISRYDRLGNTEILKTENGIGRVNILLQAVGECSVHLRLRQGPGCERFWELACSVFFGDQEKERDGR